mgnify:FL=1|tara:strand:- start:44526 stop:56441 length:11916 start_codon:yes stop_codon:yes gene_type:complete
MRKIILLLSIISLSWLLPSTASATHIAGGEITYAHLGNDSFLVTMTLYRDCSGVGMSSSMNIRINSSCTGTQNLNLPLQNSGGSEVSQICPSQINLSTCNGGSLPGMQKYIYSAIIQLSTHCSDYTFSYRQCCRNTAVNIPGGTNFYYIDATLNSTLYPNNSSPEYTAPPIPYVCLNQSVNYNYGVVENDGDSIVYALVGARTNTNSFLGYNAGYSSVAPIPGITINPATGELNFTPVLTGNFIIVTQVTEYNGAGQVISTVERDIQFVVLNCTNTIPSNPADVSNLVNTVGTASKTGTLQITANVGDQFCYDVSFSDSNPLDTLTVVTNAASALPGATVTMTGTNPVVATVCWTVPAGMNTNNTVTYQASDSACPVSGVNSLAVQIIIPQPNSLTGALTTTNISCNGVCDATADVIASGGVGPYAYTWAPTGSWCCQGLPSITGLCAGFYGLRVTDLGDPDPSTNTWDTLFIIQDAFPISVSITNIDDDDCSTTCVGGVSTSVFGGASPLTYLWSNGATTKDIANVCAGSYTLTVTDANSCTGIINAVVQAPTPPTIVVDSTDSVTCFGGSDGAIYVSANPACGVSTDACASPVSVELGTGTGTNLFTTYPAPYGNSNNGARHQILFTEAELTAAGVLPGTISSLAFYVESIGTTLNYANYTLRMGCTSATDLTTAWQTGLTEVFTPKTHSVSTGWNTHVFDVKYSWDGISNIVVEVCFNNPTATGSGNATTRFTPTTNQSVRYYHDNTSTVCSSTSMTGTSSNRPNVRFGNCASTFTYAWAPAPAAGQVTATVTNLSAQTYTVTVTSVGDGCTATTTATVNQPDLIVPTITLTNAISCPGVCDASISIASVGGQAPYTYTWDNALPATSTHSNLCAGTYNVTVTDAKSCTVTSQIIISDPPAITSSATINSPISCNGVCDGSVTINGAGGTAPLTYAWPGGLTGATQTGLCSGVYDVTITDARSCSIVQNVILIEPAVLTVSLATVGTILCNGDNTVTINSTVLGGTVAYSYAWSTGQTSANLTNVGAGTYILTVTDAHNCTATDQVVITEPTPLVGAITQTAFILCNGDLTASLTASASGGTAGYTYAWSNGVTIPVNAGIGAGNYSVTVTDANGCTDVKSLTVTEPTPVVANLTIDTQISCNGVCDGQVTVAPSGGTAPYTVTWQAGMTTAGNTATNLCGGTAYSVTITDGNNCQIVEPINLTEPTLLTASISVDQAISCGGVCDGQLTATATGGTAPFTYVWSNGSTGASINLLCGGATYTVTITDGNNCTATASQNLAEPTPVTVTISTTGTNLCAGDANVNLVAAAAGGTNTYTYLWSDGTVGATNAGLGGGTYTVTATDGNGCTGTATQIVTEPSAITASNTINTPISCNGVCDGVITIAAAGGTPGYTFAWPGGLTGTSQSNLCAGTYMVTITDGNACSIIDTIVLVEPTALVMTSTVTSHVSCNGVCDGNATVAATGGSAPIVITWPGGLTGGTQTALCGGTYTVTATDGNNCSNTISVVINEPAVLAVTLAQNGSIQCNGDLTGSISSTVTGGTTNYTYLWSNGAVTDNLTGVAAGSYSVTVTDANSCTATATIMITQPTVLDVTISQTAFISCGGTPTAELVAASTGGTPNYSYVWSSGATTPTISNLGAGTYIVTVTDANGCTDTASFIITQPTAIVANQTIVSPITCNGTCDGSATYTPTGGTAPYTIAWPAGVTNVNDTATALCANTQYVITITDANTCTINDTITLTEPTAIVATINLDQGISCGGVCDAQVTVSASGGTSPYTYAWSNGIAGATNNNLCAGQYIVTTTDGNSCTKLDTIVITEPTPVVTTITQTGTILCFGDTTATLTAATTGGTAPYSYVWSSGQTTAIITNVGAGNYSVTTTDANLCSVVTTFDITQPNAIVLTANITPMSCGGVCDAAATIIASGGTPAMTFAWPGGLTGSTQNNLCAGDYVVTVTDANACFDTITVRIANPTTIVIITNVTSHVSCNGVCDGVADITLTGGTNPLTIAWPSGGNGTTETGLCAGSHTVTVTDANGCSSTATIVINDASPIVANLVETGAISCNGVCDGVVSATITGGTAPYTVIWPGNDTTAVKTGLCAGTYIVNIVDANACSTLDTIVLAEPTAITNTPTIVNATCNANCDGQITAVPAGGTSPYSYAWSNGATSAAITNLCAGNYTVTITDARGCSLVETDTIFEPTPITTTLDARNALCGICNGRIRATATSGGDGGPYTYAWSGGFQLPPFPNTVILLCAGTYTVTVTDGSGCSAVFTQNISNRGGPRNPVFTSTNPSCNGGSNGTISITATGGATPYTYAWSSGGSSVTETGLSAGTYTVTVTDTNGCELVASETLTDPAPMVTTETITNASCNGVCDGAISLVTSGGSTPYSYAWSSGTTGNSVSSLCVGTYTVTTTDANLCTKIDTFNITEPTVIAVSLVITGTISCNGTCDGEMTATATGGTGPYTMTWSNGGAGTIAVGLCAGSHTVTVTDANGCTQTATMAITEPAAITSTATPTNATCGACDGSIAMTGTAGGDGGPYTYAWSNGQSTPTISNLCAGTYTVTITDGNGCNTIISTPISNTGGPSTAPITVANPSCNGVCDGSMTVVPTGGTLPYSYAWSSGGSTDTENALCAGIYFVTVTDANGCVFIGTDTIVEPTLIMNTEVLVHATCNATCDGSITLTTTGGAGTYSYAWSNGSTGNSLTGLCAGSYTVTTTDANSCSAIDTYVINEPSAISLSIVMTTPISCNAVCDGVLTAITTGGSSPYTYSWSNGITTDVNGSLCAGTYTVTVTDANGCTSNTSMVLGEPAVITATLTPTNATCGICDGQIAVTNVAGGDGGPYTYLWSNGSTLATIMNLCPSSYTVTITDGAGCTVVLSSAVSNTGGPTSASFTETLPTCFGTCDGSLQVIPAGGTTPYSYAWSNGSTADTANMLCAGIYTVTITDASGCIMIVSDTLTEPTKITNTETLVNASCNGVCDGSISLTTTGGSGTYTYAWDNGASGSNITALCVGTYIVTTTDGNGCTSLDTFNITEPTNMTISATGTGANCFNVCDGSATATVVGGSAPFTFVWSNGTVGATVTGLCGGSSYDVTVTDAGGCSVSTTVNITGPPAIVIDNMVVVDASCGMSNGSATATASGGTGALTYTWNGVVGNPLTGVAAGVYTLVVSDANGCSISVNVPINNDVGPTISVTGTDLTCFGDNSGSAMVTVTGPNTYSYLWNTGSTNATITGLAGGSYYVQVTDDVTGCISSDTITIAEPTEVIINNVITQSPTCASLNGGAMAFASGGTGTLSYSWNGTVINPLVNAGAGTYTLVVTDASGCSASQVIPLSDSGQFVATATSTDLLCFGDANGTGAVTVNPTGTYTYQWTSSTSDIMATVSGLSAGSYGVSVTDPATGCTAADTITVNQPSELRINNVNITNPNCGASDGALDAMVLGGTPGYTYLWNGTTTGNPIINISAGTYNLVVTDANACTASTTIPLSDIGSLTATLTSTDVPCDGSCTGTATATPSGGTGPFNYNWSNGDVTQTATALCAGLVTVTITDAAGGCTTVDTITVNQMPGLTLTMNSTNNTNCGGLCDGTAEAIVAGGGTLTYAWSNGGSTAQINGLCAGTYIVTVTNTLGCSGIDSVTIVDGLAMTLAVDTVFDANCENTNDGSIQIIVAGGSTPYTFSWTGPNGFTASNQNVTFLFTGTYYVTVTDANGCAQSDSATVKAINSISVALNNQFVCDGSGTVTLKPVVTGANDTVTYQWYNTGGGVIGNDSTLVVPVPSDTTYYVVGIVSGGCSATDTGYVAPGQIPDVDAGISQTIVIGQEVTLGGNPTTTWGGSTFEWTPDATISNPTVANPIATPTETTIYQVKVTNILGCSNTDTVMIVTTKKLNIVSGFTPNGDGDNDLWELDFLEKYPSATVEVYNRWGDLLYKSTDGYKTPWDGVYNGEPVPVGTYYYVIDVKSSDFPEPISGPVTIIR